MNLYNNYYKQYILSYNIIINNKKNTNANFILQY